MSIIPKINVGLSGKKRAKLNLDFDNSTTTNLGFIQPTMCREMVPNETFKVKVSSLVRLAPMPVPSFARMSLRHYHCFVPYSELFPPFSAFLSGNTYTYNVNTSYIPKQVPYFKMASLQTLLLTFSDITVLGPDFKPLNITSTDKSQLAKFKEVICSLPRKITAEVDVFKCFHTGNINRFNTIIGVYRNPARGSLDSYNAGVFRQGGCYVCCNDQDLKDSSTFDESLITYDDTAGFVNFEGCDYLVESGTVKGYYFACRFKQPLKNLRSIMIGLGYPFNPMADGKFSLLKLLAYYKAYFEIFRPKRQLSFNETSCYKLIKDTCDPSSNGMQYGYSIFGIPTTAASDFGLELMANMYYYLPMDYFGMSVITPYTQNGAEPFSISSGDAAYIINENNNLYTSSDKGDVTVNNGSPTKDGDLTTIGGQIISAHDPTNPLVLRLANRLLTFAGKNTVIGRQIQDYLRVHYGITAAEHHADDSSIYRLGSSRVQINVSDIMSTADTESAKIGDYAGKGIGYGDSDVTEYTAKEFGCWITMSVIVPESGYYQGYILENKQIGRFSFFHPEFDALGYQVLERGEVQADFNINTDDVNYLNTSFGYSTAFGFVPRYSNLKVGRNIVNGDLSLHSMKDSMLPYTYDRSLPVYKKSVSPDGSVSLEYPSYLPKYVNDNFRRLDPTDRLGDFNRIFNYTSNDVDHFIIHNIFNVTAIAPFKPLAESFDSVVEDDKVTQVTKA